jgi:hypothetical protein
VALSERIENIALVPPSDYRAFIDAIGQALHEIYALHYGYRPV